MTDNHKAELQSQTIRLPFGAAIEAVKRGESVKRKVWGTEAKVWFGVGNLSPYPLFYVRLQDKSITNYVPSQQDMFADDWQIV